MDHGITLLAIIHICVALLLITFVLLQDSKGGMGGAFGGGSSQTLFGATGAVNFLVKVTRGLAIFFMCSCIGLAVLMAKRTGHSVTDTMATVPPLSPKAANGVGAVPQASPGSPNVPADGTPANPSGAGSAAKSSEASKPPGAANSSAPANAPGTATPNAPANTGAPTGH